jgi:hypothetical protein
MKEAILLVEGRCDVSFFKALNFPEFQNLSILTPTECGRHDNGVYQIPSLVPDLVYTLHQSDTKLKKLGIIVDADHTNINGGFSVRWRQLTKPLQEVGYVIGEPPKQAYTGSLFKHSDGLPSVGLWIMPNHKDDGMLEDFIKPSVCEGKPLRLLDKVNLCLDELPTELKLFGHHHKTKAAIYTWLAWQEKPGQALVSTINVKNPQKNLINLQSPEMTAFKNWLNRVFT